MNHYDIQIDDRYSILEGVGRLVIIKTDRDEGVFGRDNKYFRVAKMIRSEYGCTVAVSATPITSDWTLSDEISFLVCRVNFDGGIEYVGVSDGALMGAQQGWMIPDINDMLLINGPLMSNWSKTQSGIEKFSGRVNVICGDKDPSLENLYYSTIWIWEECTGLPFDFFLSKREHVYNDDVLVWVKTGSRNSYIFRVKNENEYVVSEDLGDIEYFNIRMIAEYVEERYIKIKMYQRGELTAEEFYDCMDMKDCVLFKTNEEE